MNTRERNRTAQPAPLNPANYPCPMPEQLRTRLLGMIEVALLNGCEVQAMNAIRNTFTEWREQAAPQAGQRHPADHERLVDVIDNVRLANMLEHRGLITAGDVREYVCELLAKDKELSEIGMAYAREMMEAVGFESQKQGPDER